MNSKMWYVVIVVWMVVCGCSGGEAAEQSLAEECASKLTAVMACLNFATGKEEAPQAKCCDSVKEMKESNPACLCFVIQQIHNGTNPTLQKMNIQESRLLQLPSACKLVNASITDCPKLLKLPPNSPDAAIFVSNATFGRRAGGTTAATNTTPANSHAAINYAPMLIAYIFITLACLLAHP